MFKTLACLALSMTATATLLGWIDPSPRPPTATLSFDGLIRMARAAVVQADALHPEQWHTVSVLADRLDVRGGTLLTAMRQLDTHHFNVDRFGRITATTAWRRQQSLAGRSGTIVVYVQTNGDDRAATEAQDRSLRALLTAIGEGLAWSVDSLPTRVVVGSPSAIPVSDSGRGNRPTGDALSLNRS